MNKMIQAMIKSRISIKNSLHSNIYIMIGSYGVLAIILLCLAMKWFFNVQLEPVFQQQLPPAWQSNGDLNHLLGTDSVGHDIFNYLLVSYKTTLTLTLRATFYVVVVGAIMNYLLFFIPLFRSIIALFFRVIMTIPPLLSAIVIALVWHNNIHSILIIVGLSYLPRFVHNLHHQIIQEWQKTYITAHRLDGLSTAKILNGYIIPNIFPTYLIEVIVLFCHIILALTVLTFLGFGDNLSPPDLGAMMYRMLSIINSNYWAFFSSGIPIVITVLFIHMLNFGVHIVLTKRAGN